MKTAFTLGFLIMFAFLRLGNALEEGVTGSAYAMQVGPINTEKDRFVAVASWYGEAFHQRTMANGELFDMHNPEIAAHKTLPFGTTLLVRNLKNNKRLVVEVKDRGPFIKGRALDLSKEGARRLGYIHEGLAPLEVKVLSLP